MNIIELRKAFSDIVYTDYNHTYKCRGEYLTSCTTFVSRLKKPFNKDYWSYRKAMERGITQEDILREWDIAREVGTSRGTLVHNYLEHYMQNKIMPYDYDMEVLEMLSEDQYKAYMDSIPLLINQAHSFKAENSHLIPLANEFVVGDSELGIAGQFDLLLFNEKENEFQIWDFKTDKKFETESKYKAKFLKPLTHLQECEYNKYALQTSIYKYIIEKNTEYTLGTSHAVWFNHNNPTYKIISLPYFKDELDGLFSR